MHGIKPITFTKDINSKYFSVPNPYSTAPSCHVNLLELSRYAKRNGKKMIDLTEQELEMFKI